ncbi:hypothetical protein Bca52824_067264 [Brassica carinata]|uniref:Uncharacterized protein n=1 Tax=Brassica carinata TaxID=52824 RepID=A0A8X7QSX7_BRACI|nr:hypothetical protein Bca52824_067264 [Brassica carinata]
MLVCFDVRSEKYSFVKPPEGGMFKLINFQVLSPRFPSYLYYYNFVSEDISRVEIQGIEAFKKDSEAHEPLADRITKDSQRTSKASNLRIVTLTCDFGRHFKTLVLTKTVRTVVKFTGIGSGQSEPLMEETNN